MSKYDMVIIIVCFTIMLMPVANLIGLIIAEIFTR